MKAGRIQGPIEPNGTRSAFVATPLQVLEKDGLIFGDVPEATLRDLERGCPATDIALEQLHAYVGNGLTMIYLVPPILQGGRRNYQAAQEVLAAFRR